MRPTVAEINLSHLVFNYLSIKEQIGKQVEIMPVVKADAYGHGMNKCVEALLSIKPKPKIFGVALLEEAIELRKKFSTPEILVFGKIDNLDFDKIIKYKITPTFYEYELIERFIHFLKSKNIKWKYHLKVDTGMGRVGVDYRMLDDFLALFKNKKYLVLEGIYTHFASSDSKDKTFALLQLSRFKDIIENLKSSLGKIEYIHCANSGAILDLPNSYFNLVRPGISLYGYYPSNETSESIKLKPVMSIKTKIAFLKWVEKNTSISYGQTYFTKTKTQIGTLPIGYADGYNRLLSNKGKVICNGKVYDVVGRVCMDQILVDFKKDKVSLKDEVIVMGSDGKNKFDADTISSMIGTIPYEVCCNISKRVKRIYLN